MARDVPQKIAVKVLERAEDYPAVLAQQENVRAYPSPYGVNASAAHRDHASSTSRCSSPKRSPPP